LEEKDREWEQVVAILLGRNCEHEDLIAASDGEMDANQQTLQVHVEKIKDSEHLLQQTNDDESAESTPQDDDSKSNQGTRQTMRKKKCKH
jgi:hypothetical protein